MNLEVIDLLLDFKKDSPLASENKITCDKIG